MSTESCDSGSDDSETVVRTPETVELASRILNSLYHDVSRCLIGGYTLNSRITACWDIWDDAVKHYKLGQISYDEMISFAKRHEGVTSFLHYEMGVSQPRYSLPPRSLESVARHTREPAVESGPYQNGALNPLIPSWFSNSIRSEY